jgi:hypothetical protein
VFPVLEPNVALFFLLEEARDLLVYGLVVFGEVVEGLFFSQPKVVVEMCEFGPDFEDEPFLFIVDFGDEALLEVVAFESLLQGFLPLEIALKQFFALPHLAVGLVEGFKGVVFVFSEESAVRAKSLSVGYADDFELLVMDLAQLGFPFGRRKRLTRTFWGLL